MRSLIAQDTVVPEAIAKHRSADADAHVPQLQQLPRHPQASVPELVGVVAVHHAFGGRCQIRRALERVAAGFGHHAHRRAANLRFPHAARRRERDLLRVGQVDDVARDTGAVHGRAGIDAVHLQAAFVLATTLAAEHRHRGSDLHIARTGCEAGLYGERRNELHDRAIGAR